MTIFPAIDIINGKVVRLFQGKFDQVTEYGHDPVAVAEEWERLGAEWLHIVDLDGAKIGRMQNMDVILDIARRVKIPIQVGGGIRLKEDIARLIEGNVSRVVLGTKAVEEGDFLVDAISAWNEKIAVSIDCYNGCVTHSGWTKTLNIPARDLAKEFEVLGLKCLIYTDINRDGTLKGPNFEGLQEILNVTKMAVIASGGISDINDIRKLATMQQYGLIGAITGKALYEGKLDLQEAISVAKKS